MERPDVGRLLRSVVNSFVPNVFQVGSLGMAVVAAYDVARPLGHLALAVGLGLIGHATDGGKR
ncbi:hypothetical protein ACWD3J_15350 [Streptomyces sp. NPDC002755]|jgi:hypothetical protein|uniref:hypothetical protein n=1 Tax=Streptomyces sp. NPDC006872 TaxID=3155720 RepID=UPI0033E255C6